MATNLDAIRINFEPYAQKLLDEAGNGGLEAATAETIDYALRMGSAQTAELPVQTEGYREMTFMVVANNFRAALLDVQMPLEVRQMVLATATAQLCEVERSKDSEVELDPTALQARVDRRFLLEALARQFKVERQPDFESLEDELSIQERVELLLSIEPVVQRGAPIDKLGPLTEKLAIVEQMVGRWFMTSSVNAERWIGDQADKARGQLAPSAQVIVDGIIMPNVARGRAIDAKDYIEDRVDSPTATLLLKTILSEAILAQIRKDSAQLLSLNHEGRRQFLATMTLLIDKVSTEADQPILRRAIDDLIYECANKAISDGFFMPALEDYRRFCSTPAEVGPVIAMGLSYQLVSMLEAKVRVSQNWTQTKSEIATYANRLPSFLKERVVEGFEWNYGG